MLEAKDIMRTNLITVTEQTPVHEAIDLLAENKITGLPVVDGDNRLVGIVSEKDILIMAYHKITHTCDEVVNSRKISDVMTSEVVSFRPEDTLADVCQCFMGSSFRRVPVLDDGELVGLISRKDIISFAFSKKEITNQA
jgi:CBS domain-containing protein